MRLLLVRVGAMGDVLHALPAVAALRRARPHWEVGWVVDPRWRALLESDDADRPMVDRVHLARTREWKRHPFSSGTAASIAALRRELRARRYEACVDLQGSIRSALIGRMAGAGRYVGAEEPRERAARWMYRLRVPVRGRHVIAQGVELMGATLGEELSPGPVQLPVDAAAEQWCDQNVGDGGGMVFLAPTAGWGAKAWPAERYGEVARELAGAGFNVVVNAAGERDLVARRVVEASGGAARAMVLSLPQMIAVLRRARLVVAGDTGPLHLAAALGRPLVGLYGPTDPARTGPWMEGGVTGSAVPHGRGTGRSRVLRDEHSVTDHRRHPSTEAGLLRLGTDQVLDAAFSLLEPEREGMDGVE